MLSPETPFPYVGSYALVESEGRTQLVRILGRRADPLGQTLAFVGFPLRTDASGNKVVLESDLIDGGPLTIEEQREYHDLDRALFGRTIRTKKQKALAARRDYLRRRTIWAPFMANLMRQMRAQQERRRAA